MDGSSQTAPGAKRKEGSVKVCIAPDFIVLNFIVLEPARIDLSRTIQ